MVDFESQLFVSLSGLCAVCTAGGIEGCADGSAISGSGSVGEDGHCGIETVSAVSVFRWLRLRRYEPPSGVSTTYDRGSSVFLSL